MLRLVAAQGVADRAARVARGSRGAGRTAVRSGAVGGVLAARGAGVGDLDGRSLASHDRDRDVRAVDGPQAAWRVGLPEPGRGGSDFIHLRRFCRIALSERVSDESTVRKLTRRIGARRSTT